jgi:hypothetical protein
VAPSLGRQPVAVLPDATVHPDVPRLAVATGQPWRQRGRDVLRRGVVAGRSQRRRSPRVRARRRMTALARLRRRPGRHGSPARRRTPREAHGRRAEPPTSSNSRLIELRDAGPRCRRSGCWPETRSNHAACRESLEIPSRELARRHGTPDERSSAAMSGPHYECQPETRARLRHGGDQLHQPRTGTVRSSPHLTATRWTAAARHQQQVPSGRLQIREGGTSRTWYVVRVRCGLRSLSSLDRGRSARRSRGG